MKKSILILALCFVMLFAVAAVSAQETEVPAEEPATEEPVAEEPAAEKAEGYTVTYLENDCLAEVPTDEKSYAAGDEVTVLFEPVQYKDYLIFFGWDINNDGIADFGYNFDKFEMPDEDVELKAICIGAAGGSTCKGCHLHGKPYYPGMREFSFGGFGSSRQ
jgi:hypothetical protein